MSTSIRAIYYCYWITPHVLQSLILFVLLRRGRYRQFPIFTAYTAFEICNFLAMFIINRFMPDSYFRCYSFALAISSALRFGVVYEVFAHLFKDYASLRHLERPLLRCAAVALMALALCLAVYTHRNDADPTWFVVWILDRSVSVVQCGMLLSLFAFAAWLRLSWKKPVFGMALGLVIFLSVELATSAIRAAAGYSFDVAIDFVTLGTYQGCALIWLFYLLAPAKEPGGAADQLPEHDLEAWNQEMQNILQR